MRTGAELRNAIRGFEPSNGDWRPLDDLIAELCREPLNEDGIDALLAVLERFPTEDGAGVLWSIVHVLEGSPVYEPCLLASLRRRPAELSVVMVNRILNVGQQDLNGVPAMQVLAEVAGRQEIEPRIRDVAKMFIARHAV
jgi:hypothetical protein